MTDLGMRKQVRQLVQDSPTLAVLPDKVEYAECIVDHRERLRIVELSPPVVERGRSIRYALYDGDTLQGVTETREDAEMFLVEDDDLTGSD
jgi:hypothetical protein